MLQAPVRALFKIFRREAAEKIEINLSYTVLKNHDAKLVVMKVVFLVIGQVI